MNLQVHVKGNTSSPGPFFGHIGISVPDIKAAEQRFKEHGVEIHKPLGVADKQGMCLDEKDWDKTPELSQGFKKVCVYMQL